MVSVAPRKRTRGSMLRLHTTAMRIPVAKAVKKDVAAKRWARSSSRAPRAWLTLVPAPMPNMKATACISDMAEKITPTAPEAEVPIWLTK